MMRQLGSVIILLALAGCKPASDQADTGEAIARDAGVGARPTGPVGRPVSRAAEIATIPRDIDEGLEPKPQTPPKPTSIPEQFRGRWGLTVNDCQPGRSDAKGLLTIDDRRLIFYESRGVLDRVDDWTPVNTFTANYGFQGEGMNWERLITLQRFGKTLHRTEQGGEEGPVDLTYTACPS